MLKKVKLDHASAKAQITMIQASVQFKQRKQLIYWDVIFHDVYPFNLSYSCYHHQIHFQN